jgi:hypothetical protein
MPGAPEDEVEREPLDKEVRYTLEEARMVVPGIQALFGFQLIVAFHPRFEQLERTLKVAHLVALIALAASMALIMAPAAYHRLVERGQVSRRLVELSSRLIATAMMPLIIAISLDVFLVSRVVLERTVWGAAIGACVCIFFAALWVIYPLTERWKSAHRFGPGANMRK